ncbi:WecB/TagA/CpsF family glycosyltransferase [Microtetraspora sp. NBRC 13810]|uniref:WecB/TagA/CpsF family glycosyltransferase n=1 Tax=Microtetraspora sp. NBRC 13810 TaxID=3030990 RepID=UPI002555AF98|nr:WecB/TagA/CpsF family glycosyltransferase [Microtetraspora sp. NBRC 13810]
MPIDPVTEAEVVERVVEALRRGDGGHIVTPNVDICRLAARDDAVRRIVTGAEIVVADGMPLVWASKLSGTPVPGRVTGADLIWSLSAAAARHGHPVYLVGGPPGVPERAARVLADRFPGLRVLGAVAPPYGFEGCAGEVARIRAELVAAGPRVVFVGLGFPRQDRLITMLRAELPDAWFLGCGAALGFAAGAVRRAPRWMRRAGLEWLFRLCCEPVRLARRYLVDDLPFAGLLLARCLLRRVVRGRG